MISRYAFVGCLKPTQMKGSVSNSRCVHCAAGLSVRLQAACTPVSCRLCSTTFYAVNPHVVGAPAPKPVTRAKQQGAPHCKYTAQLYPGIKAAHPEWSRQQCFGEAAKQGVLALQAARAAEASDAPNGLDVLVAGVEERERGEAGGGDGGGDNGGEGRGEDEGGADGAGGGGEGAAASPAEGTLAHAQATAASLGHVAPAEALEPLHPPAFMPLNQRPHPKQTAGAKRLHSAKRPAASPATAGNPAAAKQQRRRPPGSSLAAGQPPAAPAAPAHARGSKRARAPRRRLGEEEENDGDDY